MLIRNKNNYLKFLFIALALMSFSAYASDAERLSEKQKQLKQQYIELERNNLGYMTKKIELETTESKLRRLKRNAAKERRALDDMIEAQSKSPSTIAIPLAQNAKHFQLTEYMLNHNPFPCQTPIALFFSLRQSMVFGFLEGCLAVLM